MTLKKRKLGSQGLEVGGLGCMGVSPSYGPAEIQRLDVALASGTVAANRYADSIMATIDRQDRLPLQHASA